MLRRGPIAALHASGRLALAAGEIEAGRLTLHGAWLDLSTGDLLVYDPGRDTFVSMAMEDRAMASPRREVAVWDVPTRLFKWALVVAVMGALLSQEAGEMETHRLFGYLALTLVLFRIGWGVIGSQTARFSDFVRGPASLSAYLKTGESPTLGHNPLGALSVIALLGLVLLQALTGLFSNDDIFFDGPWAGVVGKSMSDEITGLHHLISDALIALIILHILAITVYAAKGENLVSPMISGIKRVEGEQSAPAMRPAKAALVVLAVAAIAAATIFRFEIL